MVKTTRESEMKIKINKKGEREIKFNFIEALEFHYFSILEHSDLSFGEALDLFIKEKEKKGEKNENTRTN